MNMKKSGRMLREAQTVEVMIRQYCRLKHQKNGGLCDECSELLKYSNQRLKKCPFQEGKTSCGNCTIHCYKPAMRKKICEVMRTIGPGMILTHPIMSLRHVIDGLRKKPIKK